MVRICFFALILMFELVRLSRGLECNCRLGAEKRIVGGRNAPKIPWQAAIFYTGHFTCGGFILSNNLIMTAAHCLYSRNESSFKVVLGSNSIRNVELQFIYAVDRIIIHPNYNDSSFFKGHDIALLKLNSTINFERQVVEPGCLSFQNSSLFDEMTVSGYGSTTAVYLKNGLRTASSISTVLKYAKFKEYRKPFYDSIPIIYAKNILPNESTCSGDSGSPAQVHFFGGKSGIVGINSFGFVKYNFDTKDNQTEEIRCVGESGFVRLAFERPFIEQHSNDFCLI